MFADRRRLIFGGVVVALVALILWIQFAPAAQEAAGPATRQRAVRKSKSGVEEPLRPVRLDSLTASRSEPDNGPRNPFRFQPRPAPAPPKPVAPITKGPDSAPTMSVPVAPPGPPPLPAISLKFLGVLTRQNGVQWAVLTDGKAGPFYGREGDIIDGRYRIVKIGTESIELSYADGKGRQTVRLTGQ